MVRVIDLGKSIDFYEKKLGLKVFSRKDVEAGRFSLVFLGVEEGGPMVELTHNWDEKNSVFKW